MQPEMKDLRRGPMQHDTGLPQEEEVCRKAQQVRGHFWLVAVKMGFQLNGALVAFGLLLHFTQGDEDSEHLLATLQWAALFAFCALHLLHHRYTRWRVSPQDQGSEPDPCHCKVPYVAVMIIIVCCSSIHPNILQSGVSSVNQCIFSMGSLSTVQAVLLNLIVAASRVASFHLRSEPDAVEDLNEFVFMEACIFLGAVLTTYAVSKGVFAAVTLPCAEGSGAGGLRSSAPVCPEAGIVDLMQSSTSSEPSVVEVLLDSHLRIARPAPRLADMLGYGSGDPAASMCGMRLPLPPPSTDEDPDTFLGMLDLLKATQNSSVQLQISLITMDGALLQVLCVCDSVPGKDGCDPGYLLGMSVIPHEDAVDSAHTRPQSYGYSATSADMEDIQSLRPNKAKVRGKTSSGDTTRKSSSGAHDSRDESRRPASSRTGPKGGTTQSKASNPTFDTIGPSMASMPSQAEGSAPRAALQLDGVFDRAISGQSTTPMGRARSRPFMPSRAVSMFSPRSSRQSTGVFGRATRATSVQSLAPTIRPGGMRTTSLGPIHGLGGMRAMPSSSPRSFMQLEQQQASSSRDAVFGRATSFQSQMLRSRSLSMGLQDRRAERVHETGAISSWQEGNGQRPPCGPRYSRQPEPPASLPRTYPNMSRQRLSKPPHQNHPLGVQPLSLPQLLANAMERMHELDAADRLQRQQTRGAADGRRAGGDQASGLG